MDLGRPIDDADISEMREVDLMHECVGLRYSVDDDGLVEQPDPSGLITKEVIAGRLRARAQFWAELDADAEVMDIVRNGYKIPFNCDRRDVPRFEASGNGKGCNQYHNWLSKAIVDMETVGAVREVVDPPHIIARVDVVPKTTPGKFRLVVDLRCLNDYVQRRLFGYETLSTFRDMI